MDDDAQLYRNHTRLFGAVSVVQAESNRHGRMTLHAASIHIYDNEFGSSTTAVDVAADLLAAAKLLRAIEASPGEQ